MRKASVFSTIFAVVLSIAGPAVVTAQETVAPGNTTQAASACDLTIQVVELVAVQTNTSLNELEQLNAEILARRKLLGAAIDCDQSEIGARVEILGRLPDNIKAIVAHRKILEGLADASRYYQAQKVSSQSLRLWDIKSSSRAISAWRQETYLPLVTWADNFLIWADNQQFLERASERLTQVSRVAFSLKLVNQDEINDLFEKAQKSFDTAFEENDRARKALDQGRAGIGLIYTKASLKALANTYQVFFALQEALQKIVK